MKEKALEFLKDNGIIEEGYTSFYIQFEDGSQIELTEVLSEFAKKIK